MVKEINLGNVVGIENTDFIRLVTESGASKKVTGEILKAFIGASTITKINDYYYYQDAENPVVNDYRTYSNGVYLDFERYSGSGWERQFRIGGSGVINNFLEIIKNPTAEILINDNGDIRNLIKSATFSPGTAVGDIFGDMFLITEDQLKKVKKISPLEYVVIQADDTQQFTGTEFNLDLITSNVDGVVVSGGKIKGVNLPIGVRAQVKLFKQSDLVNPLYQNISDEEFASGLGTVIEIDGEFGIAATKPNIYVVGNEPLHYEFTFSEEITLKGSNNLGTDIYLEAEESIVSFKEITDEVNIVPTLEAKSGDDRLDFTAIKNVPTDITDLGTHSVTELNDMTDSGSGIVITDNERTKLNNISDNGTGDHWISGLEVTEHSPKDQTVDYTAGTYLINGILKTIASSGVYNLENNYANINHYSDLTSYQHRFVTLYVDGDLVIKSVQGIPADKKEVPNLPITPIDSVPIALIEIKVDGNAIPKDIDNKRITDTRNAPAYNTDEFVKVSADDLGAGHLNDKLSNNGNVTFTIENVGGIETIKADADGGTITSLEYTTAGHLDGFDVSSLSQHGILYVNAGINIEFRSLIGGTNNQILTVINLSDDDIKLKHNSGTYQTIMTEGKADKTFGSYGGTTLVYNATAGFWFTGGIII